MANPDDELFRRVLDIERMKKSEANKVKALLKDLHDDLKAKLSKFDPQSASVRKKQLSALFLSVKKSIDTGFLDISQTVTKDLFAIGVDETGWVSSWTGGFTGASVAQLNDRKLLAMARGLTIEGTPLEQFWSRQDAQLFQRFQDQVRLGVLNGETLTEINQRVASVMGGATRDSSAMTRTAVQQIQADSRRETYLKNQDVIGGIKQVSTLDGRTTTVCRQYDGQKWSLPDYEPIGDSLPFKGGVPRHWGCRSTEVPLVKGPDGKLIEPGSRASQFGPVPGDVTYEEWLDTLDEDQLGQVIGPKKAKQFKKGGITAGDITAGVRASAVPAAKPPPPPQRQEPTFLTKDKADGSLTVEELKTDPRYQPDSPPPPLKGALDTTWATMDPDAQRAIWSGYLTSPNSPKDVLKQAVRKVFEEIDEDDIRDAYSAWLNSLDEETLSAIIDYKHDSFDKINAVLRETGLDWDDFDDKTKAALRARYQPEIDLIDEALEAGRLTDDVMTFRGSGKSIFGDYDELELGLFDWTRGLTPEQMQWLQSKVGSTVTEKGYLSTSVKRKIFENPNFLKSNKIAWEIEVPKGTRGAYIEGASRSAGIIEADEAELLLGRGYKMVIDEVRISNRGWPIIRARIVR